MPMNLSGWLGAEPIASERVMFCRTYKGLESKGLIERCNVWGESNRASHLKLTEAGEEAAKELAAEAVS